MRLFLFLSAFLTLAFVACDKNTTTPDEKTGTVELVFKGRYDGAPLTTFTALNTGMASPSTINFKKLEFFLSEIQGVMGGEQVEFSDVEYISLSDLSTTELAEQGVKVTLKNIPLGTYEQLNYGVGLPDEINETEPGDYTNSPLALQGNYWASWDSYVLCRLEGTVVSGSGSSNDFLYHSGVNGMYQERSFDKSFTVDEDATTTIMFHLHGEDLFFKDGQKIDVETESSTHSGAVGSSDYNLAKRAIVNLAAALHLH